MTNFINSLRADINRDRAYVRSARINAEKGFDVSPTTKIYASIRNENAEMLRKTIKALKRGKAMYYWLKPCTTR